MPDDNRVLLTVLLHHDQSKTLDEIMAHLRKTGFYRDFPPDGLGAGLVGGGDVLRLRHHRARRARQAAQPQSLHGAEGLGRVPLQVFPAYDFAPIAATLKKEHAGCRRGRRNARSWRSCPS